MFQKERIAVRRTKIICTIGPSTRRADTIKRLAKAGMDMARLNFSHGTHADHEETIKLIRAASEELGRPIGVLADLQGPKIRVGTFPGGAVELRVGEPFVVTTRETPGGPGIASTSYKGLAEDLSPGAPILLDDGRLRLQVEKIDGPDIHCQVIEGGLLKDHKGLNLPGAPLRIELPTPKDVEDLVFGVDQGVDYFGVSFVRSVEDLRRVRNLIRERGAEIPLVPKIEKREAVDHIHEIADEADALMIARGDLGVELPPEEVPPIQKEIIGICNRKGIPVITATQMLESMIHDSSPTRAEASDVANAVLDGSDAVMLSGETAVGEYPVEATAMMHRIALLIERKIEVRSKGWEANRRADIATETAIGQAACSAADVVAARAIVALTQSGATAARISQFRPGKPILAFSPKTETVNRMTLLWGVTPFLLTGRCQNESEAIEVLKKALRDDGFVRPGDRLIFTAGLPFGIPGNTNMLRIEEV